MTMNKYADEYFNKTVTVLRRDGFHPHVLMQVFQKKDAVLCGMAPALQILVYASAMGEPFKIRHLSDGDEIAPQETVLTIEGDYSRFADLETEILGSLSRGTMLATNTRKVVNAAKGKPVFFMGARHTHPLTQAADGYAALVGGATYVATAIGGEAVGDKAMGTMPHSLIACYGGDVVKASEAFVRTFPDEPFTALVDFNNDCVGDSLRVAQALGEKLTAVRLDTSEKLVDLSLDRTLDGRSNGVNPDLVLAVRSALDKIGRQDVKIAVSGGFTAEKITFFESLRSPVDMYGVGSSILVGSNDFTADIVLLDGKPAGKVGREHRPNVRLHE
jgi:nicotinate phosphoribosyltransferase